MTRDELREAAERAGKVLAVVGACEMLYLVHRDFRHDRSDAYRMSANAGWRLWEREVSE